MNIEQKLEDYNKSLRGFGKVTFITAREGEGSRVKDVDLEIGIVLAKGPANATLTMQMPKRRPEGGDKHYDVTFNPEIKNVE